MSEIDAKDDVLVLLPRKGRFFFWSPVMLLGSGLFAWGDYQMLFVRTPGPAMLIVSVLFSFVFFTLTFGNIRALVQKNRGAMTLSKKGVSVSDIWGGERFVEWEQVEEFYVVIFASIQRIDFHYKGTAKHWGSDKGLTLFDYQGMDIYQLETLLNEWRKKFS